MRVLILEEEYSVIFLPSIEFSKPHPSSKRNSQIRMFLMRDVCLVQFSSCCTILALPLLPAVWAEYKLGQDNNTSTWMVKCFGIYSCSLILDWNSLYLIRQEPASGEYILQKCQFLIFKKVSVTQFIFHININLEVNFLSDFLESLSFGQGPTLDCGVLLKQNSRNAFEDAQSFSVLSSSCPLCFDSCYTSVIKSFYSSDNNFSLVLTRSENEFCFWEL